MVRVLQVQRRGGAVSVRIAEWGDGHWMRGVRDITPLCVWGNHRFSHAVSAYTGRRDAGGSFGAVDSVGAGESL